MTIFYNKSSKLWIRSEIKDQKVSWAINLGLFWIAIYRASGPGWIIGKQKWN